jgi:hypothetical protein
MSSDLWKLPWLRDFSPARRSVVEVVGMMLGATILCSFFTHRYAAKPSQGLCSALAEIGATLLIAYTLSVNWVHEKNAKRGAHRESWAAGVAAIGMSGLVGIATAFALIDSGRPLTWAASFGLAWALVSIVLLGVWIALLPWTMYGWIHWFSTEYPDE